MASLTVLRGGNPNQRIKLTEDAEEFVMGRSPECAVHIPNNAVSRQHAKIIKSQNGFFIEDLGSRNGTAVNNQTIGQRTLLRDNDRIKICDWMFSFHLENTPTPGPIEIDDENVDSPSTVHASVEKMSQQKLLETQPGEKLRALLEVSTALGKTFREEDLLPQIAESLFNVFKQADRCFVIVRDENSDALIPKVTKARRANQETSARFSKTIVKRCLDTGQSLLFEDAQQSGGQMVMSASIAEFRIRSVMCAPLINQEGAAFGLIQLDSQDRNRTFVADDLKLLVGVANQVAIALDNAKLHRMAIDLAVKQQDEELARKVQRSFLPAKLPEVAGYQFYAFYQAAKNVGGDYYDFIPHTEGRLGIVLGDVAGKGMPAALLMAKLSAEARYCMLSNPEISRAVGRLNEQLLQAGMMDRFVTFAACLLDPIRHTITVANAGHMSPIIYRKATHSLEDAISNDQSGFPLGMIDGMEYESVTVSLQPGDCVVVFTDGVTDSLSLQNVVFGNDGLVKAILQDGENKPDAHMAQLLGKRIITAVQKHNAGQYQNDDIALVCFSRMEDPNQVGAESGRISTATGPMTQTMKRIPGMMD